MIKNVLQNYLNQRMHMQALAWMYDDAVIFNLDAVLMRVGNRRFSCNGKQCVSVINPDSIASLRCLLLQPEDKKRVIWPSELEQQDGNICNKQAVGRYCNTTVAG